MDTPHPAGPDAPRLAGVEPAPLWTLYNRASEAARPDGLLEDPVAIDLFAAVGHPSRETFGEPQLSHVLRALCFDRAMAPILAAHPGGTVVALGEGFETGFWRIDDGRVRWLSVDLPEVTALRSRYLPANPRVRHLARSALDLSWMDEVDTGGPVLVSAQGLLMHFAPHEALGLVEACSQRFPDGHMIFDSVPPWFSRKTVREAGNPGNFQAALPFALPPSEAGRLAERFPLVASSTRVELPAGRPTSRDRVMAVALRLPLLRDLRFSVSLLRFAPAPG